MTGRILPALACGVVLPLVVCSGVVQTDAYAAGSQHTHSHQAPVRGMVVDANSNSMAVQLQTGAVTVALTTRTQVVRRAEGSRNDLRVGQVVSLRLVPGTNAVTQVIVGSGVAASHAPRSSAKVNRPRANPKAVARVTRGAKVHGHGQIVGMNGNTISVRDEKGRTTTFTLGEGTQVIKIMRGTTRDVAVGQTVVVYRDSSGAATVIEILSS